MVQPTPDSAPTPDLSPSESAVRPEDWSAIEARLSQVFNMFNLDVFTGTPDYLLAEHMVEELKNYARTMRQREKWFGRMPATKRKDLEG